MASCPGLKPLFRAHRLATPHVPVLGTHDTACSGLILFSSPDRSVVACGKSGLSRPVVILAERSMALSLTFMNGSHPKRVQHQVAVSQAETRRGMDC
jgi:hypothetical protein